MQKVVFHLQNAYKGCFFMLEMTNKEYKGARYIDLIKMDGSRATLGLVDKRGRIYGYEFGRLDVSDGVCAFVDWSGGEGCNLIKGDIIGVSDKKGKFKDFVYEPRPAKIRVIGAD